MNIIRFYSFLIIISANCVFALRSLLVRILKYLNDSSHPSDGYLGLWKNVIMFQFLQQIVLCFELSFQM